LKRRGNRQRMHRWTIHTIIETQERKSKYTYICSIQRNKNHSWLVYIYKTKLCGYKIHQIQSSTAQKEKDFTFQTVTSKICSTRHVTPSSNALVPRQKTRLFISIAYIQGQRAPLRVCPRRTVIFIQYYCATCPSESPTPHDSDLLPDANRIMPPKPGGSLSDTLFRETDSSNDTSFKLDVLCRALE